MSPITLLHDVLEDTDTTEQELTAQFGSELTSVVQALTKNINLPKAERIGDSLERISKLGEPAAIAKLCDRITNLQKPPEAWSSEKRQSYLKDAELIYEKLAPFHGYLGERLKECIKAYAEYL